jgi:hypothetical protein
VVEAIAESTVCHQRNAIFGGGAGIFVLTHFLHAKRDARIMCGAKISPAVIGKVNRSRQRCDVAGDGQCDTEPAIR